MERDKKGKVGISVGCFLPWSAIPILGLPLAAIATRLIGCSFWQVLPLRGAFRIVLKLIEFLVRINFVEPAWNPIKWSDQLRGRPSPQGTRAYPKDWLFFPDPETSEDRFKMIVEETGATPIFHHLHEAEEGGGLVEVYPCLEMTAGELVEFAAGLGRKVFVIDTCHLRRRPKEGEESPLWPWRETLVKLLDHTALIHFQQADKEELRRTLNGEETDLVRILRYLRGRYDGPILIEVPPDMGPTYYLNPLRLLWTLYRVRKLIEAHLWKEVR